MVDPTSSTHHGHESSLEVRLEARRIGVSYLDGRCRRDILVALSNSFRRGEFTLVMGPSGSGKTTLLAALAQLRRPESGSIVHDGQDLVELSDAAVGTWRRRHVGFVFQSFRLFSCLTAVENVELPLALLEVAREERRQRALEALDRLGMSRCADVRPRQLSGGEQQRVGLARASVHDPDILIADEPTAALDGDLGQEVGAWFQEMARRGHTVVATSHDDRIVPFADRILRMEDGRFTK